jgi:hypothetical protein
MPALQMYAKLGVVLNGDLLMEQCGVVIDDHVNRPCRIHVESAVPMTGHEVDARVRLGDVVKLAILMLGPRRGEVGPSILEIEGPIVSSVTRQTLDDSPVITSFTVEHRPSER